MPALDHAANVFPWMERSKALQELQLWLMFGSCTCCGDTLTQEGDMIIKHQEDGAEITERYCKTCKT